MKCYEVKNCSAKEREACFVWNSFSANPQDMEKIKCWVLKGAYQNDKQMAECKKCKYYLMMSQESGIVPQFSADLAIINCEGIINSDRSSALDQIWENLKKSNKTKVLMRIGTVSNIYSAGLGVLIKIHKETAAAGGVLVVEGAKGYVQNLLSSTKLDRLLKLAANDEEARAIFEAFTKKLQEAAAAAAPVAVIEPPKPRKERVPCYVYWKDKNPRNATMCSECTKKIKPTEEPCWIVEGMIEGISFQYTNEDCEDCGYYMEFATGAGA